MTDFEKKLFRQEKVDRAIIDLLFKLNPTRRKIKWNNEILDKIRAVILEAFVNDLRICDKETFYPYLGEFDEDDIIVMPSNPTKKDLEETSEWIKKYKKKKKNSKKYIINPEFLKKIQKSEEDIKEGRVTIFKNFNDFFDNL